MTDKTLIVLTVAVIGWNFLLAASDHNLSALAGWACAFWFASWCAVIEEKAMDRQASLPK